MTCSADDPDFKSKRLYDLLDVDATATIDEIKRGYCTQVRKWHTDVNDSPEAAARTYAINDAFARLSDPVFRAQYDQRARSHAVTLTLSRSNVDFGSHFTDGFTPQHFELHSNGSVDAVDVSASCGTWWTADIEFCENQGHLLNVTVVAHPSMPGDYTDTITFSASSDSVSVTIKAHQLQQSSTSQSAAGASSTKWTASAPRTGPTSSSKSSAQGLTWSRAFTRFARWGIPAFSLETYFFTTRELHTVDSGWPIHVEQTFSYLPLILILGMYIFLARRTGWFTKGSTVLKSLVGSAAGIGCLVMARPANVVIVVAFALFFASSIIGGAFGTRS